MGVRFHSTEHTEAQCTQRRKFGFCSVCSVPLCALCFLFSPACFGQINALPLEGWYRPGRYIPVRVPTGTARISADGAVPTELYSTASSAIVPLLTCSSGVARLKIDDSRPLDAQLRPLSSHQQIVAVAGGADQLARKLFPGETIVTIHVDPLDPLPGPALAWQSLDTLIIDGPWPGGLDLKKLPQLLAGGTQIAVTSPNRPDPILPWESIDGGWVLRPPIVGPEGCDGNDAVYAPLAAWHPDLSAASRSRIVLAGVLFSLATMTGLLVPRRFALPFCAVLTGVMVAAIGLWRGGSPAAFRAQGTVIVGRQTDRWQFIAAGQAVSTKYETVQETAQETWPIFADAQQANRSGVMLHWTDDSTRFTFALPQDGMLAFVSRSIESPEETPALSAQVQSPMTAIARSLYSRGKEQITVYPGEAWEPNASAPIWPAVRVGNSNDGTRNSNQ